MSESKPKRQYLLRKMLWFLGGYSSFLIAVILGAINYIGNSLDGINRSLIDADEFILEIETIDEHFAEQAKDRKNLFLRGHNSDDLEK
ncbi:MAG: serine/threonine protein phosphatase, partial [Cyanobacteria bacterium P01_D01_bin.73]